MITGTLARFATITRSPFDSESVTNSGKRGSAVTSAGGTVSRGASVAAAFSSGNGCTSSVNTPSASHAVAASFTCAGVAESRRPYITL